MLSKIQVTTITHRKIAFNNNDNNTGGGGGGGGGGEGGTTGRQ